MFRWMYVVTRCMLVDVWCYCWCYDRGIYVLMCVCMLRWMYVEDAPMMKFRWMYVCTNAYMTDCNNEWYSDGCMDELMNVCMLRWMYVGDAPMMKFWLMYVCTMRMMLNNMCEVDFAMDVCMYLMLVVTIFRCMFVPNECM